MLAQGDSGAKSTIEAPTLSVLIVDDMEDALRMYERYFRFRGAEVWTAGNGLDALRIAAAHHPKVVVLDLAMPHMTGWDVLRDLKQGDATRAIPVLVLSGQCAEDSALTLGAERYIEKPCEPETLYRAAAGLVKDAAPRRGPVAPVQESFACSTCRADFLVEYYVERGAGFLAPIVVTCPDCAAEMRVTLKQPPLLFAIKCVGEQPKLRPHRAE